MTPWAIRLLEWFRGHDDPIAGDLLEEHLRRGSPLWLWKQVITAIASTVRHRITAEHGPAFASMLSVVAATVLATVAFIAAMAFVLNGAFVYFALVVLCGGSAMAVVRFVVQSTRQSPSVVPDVFARNTFTGSPLNFAHVRVAGFGGGALVFVAACIGIEIHAVGTAILLSLIGGVVSGSSLIFYRLNHHSPSDAPVGIGWTNFRR